MNTLRTTSIPLAILFSLVLSLLSPAAFSAGSEAVQVNINTSDATALAAALKGVGKKRAEAIVAYREAYGPFKSLEELTEIKGLGEGFLKLNREKLTIN